MLPQPRSQIASASCIQPFAFLALLMLCDTLLDETLGMGCALDSLYITAL